jgi:hypothetical protein
MVTMVRHTIDDTDPDNYTFSNDRIETAILVSAQLMLMDSCFSNEYTIKAEACILLPDPTETATRDDVFVTLVTLRTSCLILGGEIRKASGNAISIKDGPSTIDLRGVPVHLSRLYKDLSTRYDDMLYQHKLSCDVPGEAVLSPYRAGLPGNRNHPGGNYPGGFLK